MLFVVQCPGTPEGSTDKSSGFKASQKTGQRLKVSSNRLGSVHVIYCLQPVSLINYKNKKSDYYVKYFIIRQFFLPRTLIQITIFSQQ